MIPVHLSQIPEGARQTIAGIVAQVQAEEQAILARVVEMRLKGRLPELCKAVHGACPELPLRAVFQAVALETGFSEGLVRREFYASHPKGVQEPGAQLPRTA